MSQRLQGKTAFITAAGQRLGRALAEALARQGAPVRAPLISSALLPCVVQSTVPPPPELDPPHRPPLPSPPLSHRPACTLCGPHG